MALLAVFFVLLAAGTVQGMASSTPGETLAFRLGEGSVPAVIDALTLAVVLLFLAGVYYATDRKNGTTFREAAFNWPMAVLAAILTVLILAT